MLLRETAQEAMLCFDELCKALSDAYYANDTGLAVRLAEIVKQRAALTSI